MTRYEALTNAKTLEALTVELGDDLTPEQQESKLLGLFKERKRFAPMPEDFLK